MGLLLAAMFDRNAESLFDTFDDKFKFFILRFRRFCLEKWLFQ